jgi:hypothetical protein
MRQMGKNTILCIAQNWWKPLCLVIITLTLGHCNCSICMYLLSITFNNLQCLGIHIWILTRQITCIYIQVGLRSLFYCGNIFKGKNSGFLQNCQFIPRKLIKIAKIVITIVLINGSFQKPAYIQERFDL